MSLLHAFSSEELPSLNQWQCATPLDHSLRNLRVLHLQQIVAAALALKHGPATELSTVMEQAEDWASRLKTMAEEVSLFFMSDMPTLLDRQYRLFGKVIMSTCWFYALTQSQLSVFHLPNRGFLYIPRQKVYWCLL